MPQPAPSGVAVERIDAFLRREAQRIAVGCGLEQREGRLEAQLLAARAWGVNRAWLIAHGGDPLPEALPATVGALIERRISGEPVAYILGEREFYGRAFHVSPAVLIPRPETECLVEAALARLPHGGREAVLDLGTGSGCIAITLGGERPGLRLTAVDIAAPALAVAAENARCHGVDVELLQGDGFANVQRRRFDMIVSNPPYIASDDGHLALGDLRREPAQALVGGVDGLAVIRRIVAEAAPYLGEGGWLLLEHGWDQAAAVRMLLNAAGFAEVAQLPDLSGHLRVSAGRKPGAPARTAD